MPGPNAQAWTVLTRPMMSAGSHGSFIGPSGHGCIQAEERAWQSHADIRPAQPYTNPTKL